MVFCKGVTKGAEIATELPNGVDRAIIYELASLPVAPISKDRLGEI